MTTQAIEVKPCECCREAERQITQLRKELEESKEEALRLSELWKSDVDATSSTL